MNFYRCSHCGNIIAFLENKGVPVMCCGQKMDEIIPGSVDAAAEKHVPVIKIDGDMAINLDVIGYVDPCATVNIIRDGVLVEKKSIDMPALLTDVIRCKNPRCITSTEQELAHVFKLTDRENRVYRCIYCETKGEAKRT